MAPWFALPLAAVSLATTLGAAPAVAAAEPDPDALFAQRADLDAAVRAAEIWKSRLDESPVDYDMACKLARFCSSRDSKSKPCCSAQAANSIVMTSR